MIEERIFQWLRSVIGQRPIGPSAPTALGRFVLALATLGPPARAEPPDPSPRPLTVVATVRPGACYVGQALDVSIGVVAEGERPSVTFRSVVGAEVTTLGTDLKPISASAIGDTVFQQNLYRFRYRLIPRRAGTLTVPPVAARLGARRGASDPVRLTVRNPPQAGRPAEFLGGVGPFEVEARAEPSSVRAGQAFEYRVTVRGPGARGVSGAPDVSRLDRVPLGLSVERLPDQAVADPPSHAFVYRLRPTRAGQATLPPVAVAAFEPRSGRYLTRVAPGVPVKVTEVSRLDAEAIDYGPPAPAPDSRSRLGVSLGLSTASALGGLALLAGLLIVRQLRPGPRSQRRRLRRILRQALARLESSGSDAERGRAIVEGLVSYLALTTGRPPGALTPDEAAEGLARATGSDDLARRARAIVGRCDAVRFDLRSGLDTTSEDDLGAVGRAFFLELAGRRVLVESGPAGGKTR